MDDRPRGIDTEFDLQLLSRCESITQMVSVDDTRDSLGEEIMDFLSI